MNELKHAASPYLLQHQDNPVHWMEWGERAFEKARSENKPIFLSIGYATCHWCHVMGHESFEDEQVAALLNEHYVSIKLDREERPDIDHLYMTVCQVTTGHGGWPLNAFLNHHLEPFFTATYLPKKGRGGRPGMMEVLPRIAQIWSEEPEKVQAYGKHVREALNERNLNPDAKEQSITEEHFHRAYEGLKQNFDNECGGFGQAPKFPSPHLYEFIHLYGRIYGKKEAPILVEESLKAMRYGGVYDQIGFGLHRYSTDREWLLPHFEKMLYDQAGILRALSSHHRFAQDVALQRMPDEIRAYLNRDMKHTGGAYYSAEDADSEGEEGKFYVWKPQEIESILGLDARDFNSTFQIKEEGNFKDESSGEAVDANIPHLKQTFSELAIKANMPIDAWLEQFEQWRVPLLKARAKRIRPLRDEKILTDWNAWLCSALSFYHTSSGSEESLHEAKAIYAFLKQKMMREDGQLQHRYLNEMVAIDAMAPDYLMMCLAALGLYESSFEADYLLEAIQYAHSAMDLFWDEEEGGFYFSRPTQELIARQKEFYDGAMPSANSVGHYCLQKLFSYTALLKWRDAYERIEQQALAHVDNYPQGYAFMLYSVLMSRHQAEVVIQVTQKTNQIIQLIQTLREINPFCSIHLMTKENEKRLRKWAPFLENLPEIDQNPRFYLCQNQQCGLPETDFETFKDQFMLQKGNSSANSE